MNITIKEENQQLVATLEGDLNNMASTKAERDLSPLMERNDCDIVLDCAALNYISSSGLRILLNIFAWSASTVCSASRPCTARHRHISTTCDCSMPCGCCANSPTTASPPLPTTPASTMCAPCNAALWRLSV